MEDPSVELGKLCPKMHSRVFDHEEIDLHQVMNDVYQNFTSLCNVIIAQLKVLDRVSSYEIDGNGLLEYGEGISFFVRFFRCVLKWCVRADGIVNESLVQVLTDVELHFFNVARYLLIRGSDEDPNVPEKDDNDGEMTSMEQVVKTVAKAYLLDLNAGYSPSNFTISEESVVEFIDEVLVGLRSEVSSDYNPDYGKTLSDKLRLLRNYLQFSKDLMDREKRQELLIRVEAVVDKTACFSFVNYYNNHVPGLFWKIITGIESETCTTILNVFVLEIDSNPQLTDELLLGFVDNLGKSLVKLLNDKALQGTVKDELRLLQEVLRFLVHLLFNILPKYSEQEKLPDIKMQFQIIAREVGHVIISSFNKDIEGKTATNMGFGLSYLLEKVKLIKEHVVEIIVPIFLYRLRKKFPRTDQMGFLDILLENMKELILHRESNLSMDLMDQVQKLHEDLVFFRSFLQDIAGLSNPGYGSIDIFNRIMNVAYEAEYLTNTFAVGSCPVGIRSLWVSDLMEQIKLIKEVIEEIIERKANADETNVTRKEPSQSISHTIDDTKDPYHAPYPELVSTTDVVVGFEAEMKLIKEQLCRDCEQLDVVSIIGMPGLGKTTLARKVYEDPFIVDRFQLRAWCCVSQEYNKKKMLLTILSSITELTDLIRRKSDDDLSIMLHKQLTGRRYLIVMDDVWGIEAFEDLKRFFPANSNGSRVMLTSRNKLIGLEEKNPLELRFLTIDESWDLLKQKVYHSEECPLHLYEVGKEIAQQCRGLPLAVVVVGGLLAKSDKNHRFWKQVAGNLSFYIAGDTQKQVMATLELSYNLLPNHLKPLFLYLGAFPEDNEIPVKKLIWLWIAEGLVRRSNRSLEVEAEMNLMNLIDRSLLMVAERRSNGKVKACRIHDLLRDLCSTKAKEENFLQQIYACDENLPMLPIAHPLHSALLFLTNNDIYLWKKDIESVLSSCKLLRVLHCESTYTGDDLLGNVTMPVHLRYISIRASWNSIPSSVSTLRYLESLVIKGLKGEIEVPDTIWEMVKLRHLHIDHWATFGDAVDKSSKLENLQTFSTPALYSGRKNQFIGRLPNLRKLRCIFIKGSYGDSCDFPKLESFDQLESLKVLYHGSTRPSGERSIQFKLPRTLKKLALSKFHLMWHEVSGLEKLLPNLEVLKLRLGAVDGELWDMGDVEFPKLKYLKLENLNIKRWIASPENFRCLKKLVLQRCKQLEEIPSSVGDFYSLEKMEVLWCRPSAAKSAKQILEEQKDMGNELLNVHIYPPVLDL